MKSEQFIATLNCDKCEFAQFLLVQINNSINIICTQCGYACDFQESIDQLKAARKELGEKG